MIIVSHDYSDQTIIHLDFLENWTWADAATAQQAIATMLPAGCDKVDLIINLSRSPRLPRQTLWSLRRLRRCIESITDHIVFTGMSETRQAIIVMFKKLF